MNISVNLQKSSLLCKSSFKSNPAGFQPASALDSTTEAIGLFDPVSLDLRPPGWGSPYNLLHPKSPRNQKPKKKHQRMFYCLVPRDPVSVDFSAPASKFSWQILKSQQIADWQKRAAKISASLRTKGGVTTSTSDVAQLTLHVARDLPLWHILPYQHAPTIVVDKYLRGKSQTTPGP